MIIVKLIGGLGNQMFQYAAGRCLATLHKTELRLDRTWLDKDARGAYTQREYELDVFKLKAEFATEAEIRSFEKKSGGKIRRVLSRKLPILFNRLYVSESGHNFHKEFASYPKDSYLNGYWQSEKYFLPVEEEIRSDFQFRDPATGMNADLLGKIKETSAVSLHVRRGDYVSDQQVQNYHGTSSTAYYSSALDHLRSTKGEITVFVFSDDIDWCKNNLNIGEKTIFVSHNSGKNSFEDMRLMSACKHNIIANSSFSWWAAWLNTNPEKMVIAPKIWFRHAENPDIYPKNWLVI